jgi:hypothetical protein
VIAAILLAINWRGLHGALLRALWQRFRGWSIPLYLVVMLSLLASLLKPFIFWRLPAWGGTLPAAPVLQVSAVVDTTAFIFEYFFGIYIQVYLITVCLAWIKGLGFTEEALFRFAMRRFSYALKWAGVVIVVSLLMVRLPLLLSVPLNSNGSRTRYMFQYGTTPAYGLQTHVEDAGPEAVNVDVHHCARGGWVKMTDA